VTGVPILVFPALSFLQRLEGEHKGQQDEERHCMTDMVLMSHPLKGVRIKGMKKNNKSDSYALDEIVLTFSHR
jgi:hypothetical protein